MKVLVTGASGRLGPFVVAELEQAGHQLVLMSRTRPQAEDRWPWIKGDIADFDACLQAVKGVDAIQHLAAEPSPSDFPGEERDKPFDQTIKSNILGTYYLLQAALRYKVMIFVMTGSNCALGHGYRISDRKFPFKYLPVDENHPTEVEDSYSYSKLAGEELLASYTRAYGIRTYSLRAAGICPPARRKKMAESAGPAREWNPWLWAWVGSEDVASAHRLLMEKADRIEPHGVYFCNGNDTTALEPTQVLLERFRPDLIGIFKSAYGHASLLSNEKLRRTVGWVHATSWRDLRDVSTKNA
jgi:nucleoside-diphosphate-sugar epimerase